MAYRPASDKVCLLNKLLILQNQSSNPVHAFLVPAFEFGVNTAVKALVVVMLSGTFKPPELCSATVAVFRTSQANRLLWCLYWCLKRRAARPGIQLDCFISESKKAGFSIFLFFFPPPCFDVCGEERKSCNRYNQQGNIYSFITGPQAVIKTSHQLAIILSILITSASSH